MAAERTTRRSGTDRSMPDAQALGEQATGQHGPSLADLSSSVGGPSDLQRAQHLARRVDRCAVGDREQRGAPRRGQGRDPSAPGRAH